MFIWEFLCLLIKITLVINERVTDPADIKGLVSIGLKKTIDKTDDNNLSFKMSTAGMAKIFFWLSSFYSCRRLDVLYKSLLPWEQFLVSDKAKFQGICPF